MTRFNTFAYFGRYLFAHAAEVQDRSELKEK